MKKALVLSISSRVLYSLDALADVEQIESDEDSEGDGGGKGKMPMPLVAPSREETAGAAGAGKMKQVSVAFQLSCLREERERMRE